MSEFEDLKFYAKYPFSKEAKQFIEFYNFTFDKITPEFLESAVERIKKMIRNNNPIENYKSIESTKMMEYLKDLLFTYPVSNVLVSLNGDFFIKKKYARAVADNVYYFLQREGQEQVEKLAEDFNLTKEDENFLIPFVEYVNHLPKGSEYKLVNMPLDKGLVKIEKNVLAKLVAESVYQSILNMKVDEKIVPAIFAEYSQLLNSEKKLQEEIISGELDVQAFPPCMKKIVSDLRTDNKVGHLPRFVLSTFFASINMPIDKAVEYFRTQENFDEKKTRYYLEHSYGKKGGTKYSAPSCAKMVSYGLCFKDESCHWNHPVSYYKNMRGRKK